MGSRDAGLWLNDPRVNDANGTVNTASAGQKATQWRHQQERLALLV